MPLPPGTRFGPYEILSVIGAGGMGEVYRGRDTNLKRDVAIKVLLPAVAADPDRLARFTREARILASLSHPNIALIHGIAESDGMRVFAMEFIDGPSLSERIAQGAIPLGEALVIARQITDALEAAHEQGIVHRDLKPANIKVRRDGTVKILDFGIAKTVDPPAASTAAADQAEAATTTTGVVGTRPGVVFGTAPYMSPEHVRGLALDKRTDIWAFGCLLYEMLTGRPPFSGQTLPDIQEAILTRDPDWTRLPGATPAPIVRLARRCLEKDRRRRLADAADARLDIDEALDPAYANATPAAVVMRRRSAALPISIALAAGALIAGTVTWAVMRGRPEAPSPTSRFTIVPPPAQSLDVHDNDRNLALSPDGRHLVYRSGGSSNGGPLMLRAIDSLDAQPLAGVINARGAFFSFDGRSVAFFDRSEIRRMPLTGEPPTTICTFPDFFPRGGTWGDDNTIIFATSDEATGLWRVPAAGGTPVALTTPEPARKERDHLFPSMLPGGRGVLFTVTQLGQQTEPVIAVLDFRSGQRHTLLHGSQAEYVAPRSGSGQPGYLVYAAGGALRAVRFDLSTLQVLGESVGIVDRVQIAATGGAANYAVATNGTLAYLPGEQAPPRSLVWVDREGREERIPAQPLTYAVPRLSPDGKRLAVEMRAQDHDLWLWEFASRRLSKLTFGSAREQSPVWTPDGRQIVFASDRAGPFNVYVQNADGTGGAERLTAGSSSEYPTTITADGLRVICNQLLRGQISIVGLLRAPGARARPSEPVPLINTPFEEIEARLSRDGRFLAYQSNESGRFQVYVQPFPHVGAGRWQVTQDGGTNPTWARNGTELFYLDGSSMMTAVPVQTAGPTFVAGNPTSLFDARIYSAGGTRAFDVSLDDRFILVKDSATAESKLAPAGIIVVLNWFDELRAWLRPG